MASGCFFRNDRWGARWCAPEAFQASKIPPFPPLSTGGPPSRLGARGFVLGDPKEYDREWWLVGIAADAGFGIGR
jgi:hypothetical protein